MNADIRRVREAVVRDGYRYWFLKQSRLRDRTRIIHQPRNVPSSAQGSSSTA